MKVADQSKQQLIEEVSMLRQQVAQLEAECALANQARQYTEEARLKNERENYHKFRKYRNQLEQLTTYMAELVATQEQIRKQASSPSNSSSIIVNKEQLYHFEQLATGFLTSLQIMRDQLWKDTLRYERATPEKQLRYKDPYRIITRTLPEIAILFFDKDLRHLIAEGAILKDLGFEHPLEGKLIWELLSAKQCEKFASYYESALAGTEETFELNHNERIYQVYVSSVKNEEGLLIAGAILFQDITTRKQAKREKEYLYISEQEQRLRAEMLDSIFSTLTAQMDQEAILDEILSQAQKTVPYRTANIVWLEGDKLSMVRSHGYHEFGGGGRFIDIKQSLSDFPLDAQAIKTHKPIVVPDTRKNPAWRKTDLSASVRSFMAIPICLQDRVLGLFRIDSYIPNRFTDKDAERLLPLVNAAAIALENARLYEQLYQELADRKNAQQEMTELNRNMFALLYAGATISVSMNLQDILTMVTKEMINMLNIEGCIICEWDQENDTISVMAQHGPIVQTESLLPRPHFLKDFPLAKQALIEREPCLITSSQTQIYSPEHTYMQKANIKTLLLLPMEFQNQVVGLVEVIDSQTEWTFTESKIAFAQFLANQAANAIENARLYSAIRQRLKEQTHLRKASIEISSSLELETVLNQITKQMGKAINATSAYFCSYDEETMTSTILAKYCGPHANPHEQKSLLDTSYSLPRDFTRSFVQLQKNQPELTHRNQLKSKNSFMHKFDIKSLLNIPLHAGGKLIAFVELWETQSHREFTSEEITHCQDIARHAAVVFTNAQLHHQVQREANRNQAILNAIPDSMFYFNQNGQLLDCKVIDEGNSLSEILNQIERNKTLDEIPELPSDLVQQILYRIDKVLSSQSPQMFEYQLSTTLLKYDLEIRLVMSDSNEVLAIVRNITERKQAERQTILTERLAALGQLAAALAHEINNPLQAIQSPLDLMLKYNLKAEERKEYLKIIQRQINRLKEFTTHVLNFAHPREQPFQAVYLAEVIEQVLVLTQKQLEKNGIQATIKEQKNSPPVWAIFNQLEHIFLNIILNTIEALSEQGSSLYISIYTDEEYVVISFTNDGPPIPNNVLPHIFEPFYTTSPGGNGLGLWTCHNLVEQLRGSIRAENLTKKQGVVFTIKLPQAQKPEKES